MTVARLLVNDDTLIRALGYDQPWLPNHVDYPLTSSPIIAGVTMHRAISHKAERFQIKLPSNDPAVKAQKLRERRQKLLKLAAAKKTKKPAAKKTAPPPPKKKAKEAKAKAPASKK